MKSGMTLVRTLMKPSTLALAIFCLVAPATVAAGKEKAADKWVDQGKVTLSPKIQLDGDSFGMEMLNENGNKISRTYRLYGTDCPESDEKDWLLAKRI